MRSAVRLLGEWGVQDVETTDKKNLFGRGGNVGMLGARCARDFQVQRVRGVPPSMGLVLRARLGGRRCRGASAWGPAEARGCMLSSSRNARVGEGQVPTVLESCQCRRGQTEEEEKRSGQQRKTRE